jgi:hypothetical protein
MIKSRKDILEDIFKVYGFELPNDRSLYSATVKSPVPVLQINKAFKSWRAFYEEYLVHCAMERRKAATEKVVTKKAKDED